MHNEEDVFSSIMKMVTAYAKRSPYFLNPEELVVKNIVRGLARNKIKYGYAYCPCRPIEDTSRINKNDICPCCQHKEEIALRGSCECGLFVSKNFIESKNMK